MSSSRRQSRFHCRVAVRSTSMNLMPTHLVSGAMPGHYLLKQDVPVMNIDRSEEHLDAVVCHMRNRIRRYPKAIFRNRHDMELTMPNNVRSSLEYAHMLFATRSFQIVGTTQMRVQQSVQSKPSQRSLTPSRGPGFLSLKKMLINHISEAAKCRPESSPGEGFIVASLRSTLDSSKWFIDEDR